MVASANGELYSPFQPQMLHEEGPQSSEEGSGLHSPVFGAPYPPPHGDSFRYQTDHLDVHHAAGILAPPQFDYGHPSMSVQQPPILDTARLELPSPSGGSARHVTFPSHSASYSLTRNHLGLDFPVQSPVNSRIPHSAHNGGPIDFRYTSPSERRLPGGPSHDQSYPRPGANSTTLLMDADHRPPLVSPTERAEPSVAGVASSSRESRKEISSVVIACRQCRGRKIRCDSTRPVCNNCVRRSNVCEYDAVPKRRGPDKHPGTRQRSCKKRPADGSAPPPSKRKRTTIERSSEARESAPSGVKENMADDQRSPSQSRHTDRPQDTHLHHSYPSHPAPPPTDLRISTDPAVLLKQQELSPTYRRPGVYGYEHGSHPKSSFPRQLDVNTFQSPNSTRHRKFQIPTSPIVESEQKAWWSKILNHYASIQDIADSISFLISNTGYLLSFINTDFLYKRLWDDEERLRIQPAFILAALGLSKLIKSSSVEESTEGLRRAMLLKADANSAYSESMRSNWIDATLAEAALILALFESSAYPDYTHDNAAAALFSLDEIVHLLQLTTNDIGDAEVCRYPANTVPYVDTGPTGPYPLEDMKCSCFPPDAVQPPDPFSNRPYTLPWDPSWTSDEVRDEEVRRLCWSALSLASNYSAQCAAFNRAPPNLQLNDPANYLLLFPGEVSDRMSPSYRSANSLSTKESVWALYCRSMLLWNFCNRFRTETTDYEEKAEHAHEAFLEAQAIQDSLDMHKCNLDTTLIYMCREYIYNTRLLVTQALRRLVNPSPLHGLDRGPTTTPGPIFKRKQAEDWLYYQDQVIYRVNETIHNLHSIEGQQLTRRPFRASWFLNQLAICLTLWDHDQTLQHALQLANRILPAVDVMNALWPSHVNRATSNSLRQRLANACARVGMDPPFSPSYTLPPLLTNI